MPASPLPEDPEILAHFLAESSHHLSTLESHLMAMSSDEDGSLCVDLDRIHEMFRGVHSIKGAASILGLAAVARLSHNMEDTLDSIRCDQVAMTSDVIASLNEAADNLQALIDDVFQPEVAGLQQVQLNGTGTLENKSNPPGLETPDHDVCLRTTFEHLELALQSVAGELHKDVRIEITGADLNVPASVAGAVTESLLHVVRNAIDHGIESPQIRLDCGKEETACVSINLRIVGDDLYVSVHDDGRGINLERIRRRAEEIGLVVTENSRDISDEELISLIFVPGFSTATEVTEISGRGVGMDVVYSRMHSLGGDVKIISQPFVGTTVHLCLPLAGS